MFAGVAFPECFKSPGYMNEHLVVAIGNVSGFGYPDKPVPVETTGAVDIRGIVSPIVDAYIIPAGNPESVLFAGCHFQDGCCGSILHP